MTFKNLYTKRLAFLEYSADWIIRFYNQYLKNVLPKGRILDYGCGSGNNSVFFITKGYEVYGIEITEAVTPLIAALLKSSRMNILRIISLIVSYQTKSFIICRRKNKSKMFAKSCQGVCAPEVLSFFQ